VPGPGKQVGETKLNQLSFGWQAGAGTSGWSAGASGGENDATTQSGGYDNGIATFSIIKVA
jgi:hypothetical protein